MGYHINHARCVRTTIVIIIITLINGHGGCSGHGVGLTCFANGIKFAKIAQSGRAEAAVLRLTPRPNGHAA